MSLPRLILMLPCVAVAALALSCAAPAAVKKGATRSYTVDDVKKELASRNGAVRTLRETATIRVKTKEGQSLTVSANVALKRPGSLKVELLGPFMEVEGLFVLKDGMYLFLSMQERSAKAGMATSDAIGRALNVPVAPEDLEAFFCGTVPASDLARGEVTVDPAGGWIGLAVETPSVKKEYVLSPDGLEVVRLEVGGSSGRGSYLIEFLEHFSVNGVPLPKKARASADGRLKSVEIKFHEAELNTSMEDTEFQIDVPAEFRFE